MHRKREIDDAGIGNRKNKRIRCLGSVKLMMRASGIGKQENPMLRKHEIGGYGHRE